MAYADYFDRLLTFETFFLFADNLKGETPLRSLLGKSCLVLLFSLVWRVCVHNKKAQCPMDESKG